MKCWITLDVFVVDEIHVVDVVDVLRVVGGEDIERFGRTFGRSTKENQDVVRVGYTNEWKDCCLSSSLNRFGCGYAHESS